MTGVAKLGYVAARTPDLEESLWFFRDVLGFKVVERAGDTAYLRGMCDWQHHTLRLTAGDAGEIEGVGWRTESPEALERLSARLAADLDVERVPADAVPGVGETVRFEAPGGHRYELYYDVEKPDAPAEVRSKLKNRVYSPAVANRVAPQRIDHAHVQDPVAAEHADWLRETFGMETREVLRSADGTTWGWWMSVTALPHDIGVHRIEDGPSRFHHVSYHVDDLRDLWDAADILREHGIAPDGGPGRHAITKADFLYVRDPASGLRIELFAGPGYLIFEPDWETIEWSTEEIGSEDDHQWIGTQYSAEGTPYH